MSAIGSMAHLLVRIPLWTIPGQVVSRRTNGVGGPEEAGLSPVAHPDLPGSAGHFRGVIPCQSTPRSCQKENSGARLRDSSTSFTPPTTTDY